MSRRLRAVVWVLALVAGGSACTALRQLRAPSLAAEGVHAGVETRTQCLVCHLRGEGGVPRARAWELESDAQCTDCHRLRPH